MKQPALGLWVVVGLVQAQPASPPAEQATTREVESQTLSDRINYAPPARMPEEPAAPSRSQSTSPSAPLVCTDWLSLWALPWAELAAPPMSHDASLDPPDRAVGTPALRPRESQRPRKDRINEQHG